MLRTKSFRHHQFINRKEKFTAHISCKCRLTLTFLFYAAQNGYTRVVKILLQVAFNVNASHERLLVIDFAYKNHHFETVFELLKLNSMFPYNLNVEECPENIKEFAEMSKKFHENIQAGNIEEISQTLTQHPNLRYFYSPGNLSACAMAIGYKQFDIYELFINKQFSYQSGRD
ncbi:hypothetical protein PVAND_016334 [Polypedilum vanderplanki]|uniref:Uncharacterized protein n=1 Tax=Polypedilum vanderplanki TaxID=319348 RepID=A0A9J6BFB4_POLVA|nr:hypothetical protein PVAND_016334 [Polypedilum vanderplanki]